jgi:hypothetical protein
LFASNNIQVHFHYRANEWNMHCARLYLPGQ